MDRKEQLIIVRGGGDIATGTIYKLNRCGFPVLVLEAEQPSAIRRRVAFSEAVYDGKAQVEDMLCFCVSSLKEAWDVMGEGHVALLKDPECRILREAKPWAIMTSYNLVNGVWSHYNYHLATAILRREWGFDGVVITDWWMQQAASPEFPQLRNNAYRLRAQVDVLMPGELENPNVPRRSKAVSDAGLAASLTAPDGLTLAEAQRSAANVLQFLVRRADARRAQTSGEDNP